MSVYDDLQEVTKDVLAELGQGVVRYLAPGDSTGPEYDPQPTSPTPYAVDATVRGVRNEYVDGTYVVMSDLEVTIPAFSVEPSTEGVLDIDGREHEIVRVLPIPAAGTPVAWRLIARS